MISYAQNREDVVLATTFSGQADGFYVDVGAGHPVVDSVTKIFYDRGWRGINIEPSPRWLRALERQRPEDVNLGVGLSDEEGRQTLFLGPPGHEGESTFREDLAARFWANGPRSVDRMDVAMLTLATVCERYVRERAIDFLKIDVEGFEGRVVGGANLSRWRPRVVVVEATLPNSPVPSERFFEPALLNANYVFALFDGLNRFYARDDETEIFERLCELTPQLYEFM